jgi:hypothetical protein
MDAGENLFKKGWAPAGGVSPHGKNHTCIRLKMMTITQTPPAPKRGGVFFAS